MDLTKRQQVILAAIVEEYIHTGQPVSSKLLNKNLKLGVSTATIRNDMAVLYDLGYLEQPHTSAGRIPSHIGIRKYIDSLMECDPLSVQEKNYIDSLFNVRSTDPDQLLGDAADALSDYTGYATVTSSLIGSTVRIRRLEFVAAGENTLVIILMASNGVVRSKVIRVDFPVTDKALEFICLFTNSRFSGRSIESITTSYVKAVSMALGDQSRTFAAIILAVYQLCQEITHGKYYVSGSTKLLSYTDDFGKLAQDLLGLIDNPDNLQKLFGPNILDFRILVGKENSAVELTDSSVVVTRYFVGGMPGGTVGLIGPMRLDYSHVIPHLEYFARTLGYLLDDTLEADEYQKQL